MSGVTFETRAAGFVGDTKRYDELLSSFDYTFHVRRYSSEREHRFTDRVHQILNRGGKVLLPVVALGRWVVEDRHSTGDASCSPPPRVYMSIHTQGKSCSKIGRVLALNDPPAGPRAGAAAHPRGLLAGRACLLILV